MAAGCNDKSALNDAAALFIELDDTMPKNITISYPVDVKLKTYKQKSISIIFQELEGSSRYEIPY
jgi:hypothetical protein